MARKATATITRQPVEPHAHTVDAMGTITGSFRSMPLAKAYTWGGEYAITCEGLHRGCDLHTTAAVRALPKGEAVPQRRDLSQHGALDQGDGTTWRGGEYRKVVTPPARTTKAAPSVNGTAKRVLGTMEVITDKQGRKVHIHTQASKPGEWRVKVKCAAHQEVIHCYSAAEALTMAGLLDAWCEGCQ